jgi:hypothetical protein
MASFINIKSELSFIWNEIRQFVCVRVHFFCMDTSLHALMTFKAAFVLNWKCIVSRLYAELLQLDIYLCKRVLSIQFFSSTSSLTLSLSLSFVLACKNTHISFTATAVATICDVILQCSTVCFHSHFKKKVKKINSVCVFLPAILTHSLNHA